jgi:hypothetical protein
MVGADRSGPLHTFVGFGTLCYNYEPEKPEPGRLHHEKTAKV